VEARLAERFAADANDYIYSYDASRDYDRRRVWRRSRRAFWRSTPPTTSANPIELGILEREIKRVKTAATTRSRIRRDSRHGTSGEAKCGSTCCRTC